MTFSSLMKGIISAFMKSWEAIAWSLREPEGVYFAVWAPDAERVYVIGDFNDWHKESHPLGSRGQSGIWEGFIPGVQKGAKYKYYLHSRYQGYRVEKADPFCHFL